MIDVRRMIMARKKQNKKVLLYEAGDIFEMFGTTFTYDETNNLYVATEPIYPNIIEMEIDDSLSIPYNRVILGGNSNGGTSNEMWLNTESSVSIRFNSAVVRGLNYQNANIHKLRLEEDGNKVYINDHFVNTYSGPLKVYSINGRIDSTFSTNVVKAIFIA